MPPLAIAVHSQAGQKLGYAPRALNEIPSSHRDRGRKLHALVKAVDPAAPPWEMLEITVVSSPAR